MTKYNPDIHHRRSIRLKNYDYSQSGLYFITICTNNRANLFGEIINGEMILNDAGKMVNLIWNEIPIFYSNFKIHEQITMPNHLHGIIEIIPVGADPRVCPDTNRVNHNIGQSLGIAPTMDNVSRMDDDSCVEMKNMLLSQIIQRFKTMTLTHYIKGVKTQNWPSFDGKIWQRNYYEHIIRDEKSYIKISDYIINNPTNWQEDKYHA